ncbi:DNA polymerase subunit gamma-1-like [Haliotis asinina]|uniref:DNA polymerase subunit gamma-1-like n=1 Tax=Haliotis asinina TaxID=109174 RepID=UPI003532683A
MQAFPRRTCHLNTWCRRQWFHRSMNELQDTTPQRTNPLQIQMLSETLHKQIFKETEIAETLNKNLKSVENHLQKHGLWNHATTVLDDVDLKLPPLQGSSIEEHFYKIAEQQIAEYKSMAENLCSSETPPLPDEWVYSKGWTKYLPDGSTTAVPYPEETAIVFDIECLMTEGQFPTMATAVSDKYWYSWVSDYVVEDKYRWSDKPTLSDLIPLETKRGSNAPPGGKWQKRLIIGHNVGFDRSFVKEQYYTQPKPIRFLDTMSMHIAICGLTNFQRILYQASGGKSMRKEVLEHKEKHQKWHSDTSEDWKRISTMNNLNDVYQLHCKAGPLKKATREVFIEGNMHDVRDQFQELMMYCANDVLATQAVFRKLWPQFLQRFPHPVTLAGMLEMGTSYLPVNTNWERYIQQSNTTYSEMQRELKNLLMSLANDACALLENDRYKDDPWLWDLDWNVKDYKLKKLATKLKHKDLFEESLDNSEEDTPFKNPNGIDMLTAKDCIIQSEDEQEERDELVAMVMSTAGRVPKNETFMAGYPAWYRELCPRPNAEDWYPGPSLISTQVRVTPKLLRLTWEGYPVHYNEQHGWGYLVPGETESEMDRELANQDDEEDLKEEERKFPIHSLHEFLASTKPELYSPDYEKIKLAEDPLGRGFDANSMEPSELRRHWALVNETKPCKPFTASPGDGPFDIGLSGCVFYKIPHKDGNNKRVGNPLAKDYLLRVEDGTLRTATGADADRVLSLGKMCSYWKNNQQRIEGQMAVWMKKGELPKSITSQEDYEEDSLYGAVVPRIVPAGTITRRAVEQTWLTASNAYPDRIGSELKAMVQVPPGYHFVGADVDSQELWIASIIGDATFQKIHGCTALGWMTLQGNKADKTDLHSKTAETVSISRDHAKVMNYGRIYGAGQRFAERLLVQFNPRLTPEEAKQKAKKMYMATKGKRSQSGLWVGGTESHMFNGLEKIARSEEPLTPVLGCRISRALEPEHVLDDFMTSRVNWVVQSSAVDYLHLMLVSMRWLLEAFSIRGRFCISIHDEVRYLVRSEDRYRAALALQITNLWTRSMFASRLGMKDLPQSVAFFSNVDIDTCLRKEVVMDCKTPSNPHGLARGYGIPQGTALDIYEILKITNGTLCAKSQNKTAPSGIKEN